MIAALIRSFVPAHRTLAKLCGMPYILAQSAVPACLAPNGTVATDGTITLGTALPTTYSGGIWLRLPAGAVSGGSAGMYYAVMSSTTVGQVYTNYHDPASEFIPYIPSSLTAAVGSNVAYTQTTGADVTLINAPLTAAIDNVTLRITETIFHSNSAGSKIPRSYIGSDIVFSQANTTSLSLSFYQMCHLHNGKVLYRNSANIGGVSGIGPALLPRSSTPGVLATGQLSSATDYIGYMGYCVEILP